MVFKLVSLVEIQEDRQRLSNENRNYSIKEVLINRDFIVAIKPNHDLKQKLIKLKKWPANLNEKAEFVKIHLSGVGNGSHTMNIIGNLEIILEKLRD